ncbi:MAG TPA: hypothetical protein VGP46_13440 [Acidimicrobiales bacterium]|jgi:cell division protein FtsL|nr:hypothetical protein [Acidimicrobiales bacterium]
MATRDAAVRDAGSPRARQADPAGAGARKARPQLGVLDRRHVLERARRRQARALLMLSALCIAVPLMVAALGHALVAADQVKADGLQTQISSALQTQQNLQLQRAQLTAPTRILSIAENTLHMVTPPAVTYLAPVNPGKSVLQSHGPGSTGLASSVTGPADTSTSATKTPKTS